MRVLQIVPLLRDGAGVFEVELSKQLVNMGHEVWLASSQEGGGLSDWPFLVGEILACGIPYLKMEFFERDLAKIGSSILKLVELVTTKQFDILHVHSGVPALAARVTLDFAGLSSDVGLVATFHSWNPQRPFWMDIMDAWSFNLCDFIVFVSRAYLEVGCSKGVRREKSLVIYPGVKIKGDLPPKRREFFLSKYRISKDAFVIGCVAGITRKKGQEFLLKAVEELCRRKGNIHVLFVGDIIDRDYYEELVGYVRRANLEDHVTFTGWVRDVSSLIACLDVFVLPTLSEGFGLVLVEAMHLGVPVVASYVEGTKDILINGYNALAVPPGNASALTEAVMEVMENTEKVRVMAERAREWATRTFSWEKTARQYEEVYKAAISKAKARRTGQVTVGDKGCVSGLV